MIVRPLTPAERDRLRACLTWCQRDREPDEPEDYTEKRLDEARQLWPDVAELIGFALALPKQAPAVSPAEIAGQVLQQLACSHKFVGSARCVLCGWDPSPR
jgi:hypothetical protein